MKYPNETKITPDYEHILRRLVLAEQEIARARTRGTIHAVVSLAAVAAVVAATWGSPILHADMSATVRAPFVVLDSANRPILTVHDGTSVKIKGGDGKEYDNPSSNRGLTVSNEQGDAVARVAVDKGHGYVMARRAGSGKGLGGPSANLAGDDDGGHITIMGTDKKSVRLSSDAGGLSFEGDAGTIFTALNRTHLWIGNAAGQGLVEAGETKDGRGRVTVGPRFGGPQGGGAITFPYMILGRK
jgi:hypothetical protein